MERTKAIALASALFGVAALVGPVAVAEPSKDAGKGAAQPKVEMKLPPGWTLEDAMACAAAATPGKMHEHLAKGVGTWRGETTMWPAPGAEPITSECKSTVTMVMGGRYARCEMEGDMGMGPYNGLMYAGFDNVAGKFVLTWLDTCGTGMARGTGELSSDGKVMTWTITANCAIRKGPTTLREVETITGEHTRTIETFMEDPKSGKEFRVMRMELARK